MKAMVILLNGASSAGKTTLAREIRKLSGRPFEHLQVDSFAQVFPETMSASCLKDVRMPAREDIVRRFHQAIAEAAAGGKNVIADHVLGEEPGWVDDFLRALRDFHVLSAGVYCELPVLIKREHERSDRAGHPDVAERQYRAIHNGMLYDVTVDTTSDDPSSCAKQIIEFMESGESISAIRRMGARQRNILLVGGVSETRTIAEEIAGAGFGVLVSTSTGLPLDLGRHPLIRRRCGVMDAEEFARLIKKERIVAVVNAAHPYAAAVRPVTREAARLCEIPHFEYLRPSALSESGNMPVRFAASHAEAARMAVRTGRRIFLTIGTRNLAAYVAEARRHAGVELFARAMPCPESLTACLTAGLRESEIISGSLGAIGIEETENIIRTRKIDVLVTKDSGTAGGADAKCEAARRADCAVIVVRRPEILEADNDCANEIPALMELIRSRL